LRFFFGFHSPDAHAFSYASNRSSTVRIGFNASATFASRRAAPGSLPFAISSLSRHASARAERRSMRRASPNLNRGCPPSFDR